MALKSSTSMLTNLIRGGICYLFRLLWRSICNSSILWCVFQYTRNCILWYCSLNCLFDNNFCRYYNIIVCLCGMDILSVTSSFDRVFWVQDEVYQSMRYCGKTLRDTGGTDSQREKDDRNDKWKGSERNDRDQWFK